MNDIILSTQNGEPVASSRQIAESFGKEHKDVLRAIENIKAQNCALTSMFFEATYTEDKAICCISGMHACENPLDVFQYYRPDGKNRFFEVECNGAINKGENDSKLACTELKVTGELSLAKFIRLSVQTTFELAMNRAKKKTSGYYSSAATSGDYSSAATSGESSSAATSGDSSTATATGGYCSAQVEGKNSLAIANGAHSKARGVLGCYLVLTEYDDGGKLLWAKIAKVDGTAIKENVWYTLKNGEFEEA